MNHRLRRWGLESLKIAIGAALLGLLWNKGLIDPVAIGQALARHPWWMALGLALHGLMFYLLGLRWKIILGANHIPATVSLAHRLTLVSHFFSSCLPGNGAGDLVKGWLFSRRGTEFGSVLGTMVLDRILGMAGLFLTWSAYLLAAIASRPGSASLFAPFFVVAALAGTGLLILVWFSRGIDAWLRRLPEPRHHLARRILDFSRRTVAPIAKGSRSHVAMAAGIALAVCIQNCYIVTAWAAGYILSIPVDLVAAGAVLPLVSLVNAIPLSPGGVGLGEAVGAAALREFSLPSDAGAQVVLVVRIASVFWAVVGAIAYLSIRPANAPAATEAGAAPKP